MPLHRSLIAFSSRNYCLFFGGQVISLVGTWMTTTASLWLIYHLTSSPSLLGLVGFAGQIPIFLCAPFAGVWIDRVNKHRLLILTQVLSMAQSFGLAALTYTGTINARWLVGMSLVQGLINAVDMPVRLALVVEFIERKEHLGNAIALNSTMFNLARLIGPAIGGLVIARYGAGRCFFIDGVSYLAVIAGLLAMRLRETAHPGGEQHPVAALREGFRYAFAFKPIRALIIMVALVSLVGFSYPVLLPIFARDVFGGDARTLGYLMSATGVGAISGALYLGTRHGLRGLGNVIVVGGALMATGMAGFALSRWFPVSLACGVLGGLGAVLLMASSNTLVQSLVEDDKRGRVLSIFTMSFTGTMPLGNLMMGAVAGAFGPRLALGCGGGLCAIIIWRFHRQLPELRRLAGPHLDRLEKG